MTDCPEVAMISTDSRKQVVNYSSLTRKGYKESPTDGAIGLFSRQHRLIRML